MKKKEPKYKGYRLVPETTGKITDGVYIREDNQALIVSFAWGNKSGQRDLHFKPMDETDERN
jgi:hypothetical protein